MDKKVRFALITGASGGIGYELARLFAKDGYGLVLVARSEERLHKVAEELKELGSPRVMVIAKDLSVPYSADSVYEATRDAGLHIHVLVNNAGAGVHGFFHETELRRELEIIQLNVVTPVHLAKLYLKDMLKMGEGHILNVASIASYQPTPLLAVYAATKAFVLSFNDALVDELKDTKVKLTALIPGPTATDFFRKAGAENTVAATEHPADPAEVAKTGYDSFRKKEHHAVAPGMRRQVIMSNLLPNERVTKMAHKQMEEKE